LTALDDGFVKELGGLDKIKVELGPACPIHFYEGGIVIQAGPRPQLGDSNRGIVLEEYRRVARLVKPLRFEAINPKFPLLSVNSPLDAQEESVKWLRRFD